MAEGNNTPDARTVRTLDDAVRVIAGWLRLIVAPGAVTEVRAVDVPTRYGRPYIEAGYFDCDHFEEAAKEAVRLSVKEKARGV